jgi:hypothetical protein
MDIEIFCNTNDETLFKNIEINSKRNLPWVKSVPEHDGHAVIVGGGPSLADCLDTIKWRQSLGQKIFALNNAGRYLLDRGIEVDYQVIVDARPHNANFTGFGNTGLYASQCDPSVFDMAALSQDVILWHPVIDDWEPEFEGEYAQIGGGTTVGLSAMCLAYTMGYRKLHLFGYDSSHREAGHAYRQPENDKEPECQVSAYGKTWTCSLAMARQAELFPEVANNLIELGCVITMDGDGLLPTAFRHMWSAPISEKDKYQAMWELPSYSTVSPGELIAPLFCAVAKPMPHELVIDFGCGSGKGGKRIKEIANCRVNLVDFAENCCENILIADLSKRMSIVGNYGFCADVMEHIPPDQVDDVIKNICDCVDYAFFQISLVPDRMGALIGQTLHLSVHPFEWWKEKLQGYGTLTFSEDHGDSAVFYLSTT